MVRMILHVCLLTGLAMHAHAATIQFGDISANTDINWHSVYVSGDQTPLAIFAIDDAVHDITFTLSVTAGNFTDNNDIEGSYEAADVWRLASGGGLGVDSTRQYAGQTMNFSIAVSGSDAGLLESLSFNQLTVIYEGKGAGEDDRTLYDGTGNEVTYDDGDATAWRYYNAALLEGAGLDALNKDNTDTWELSYALLNLSTIGTTAIGDISFDYSVAVPEPSSTALLGLGGFALLMRRRR